MKNEVIKLLSEGRQMEIEQFSDTEKLHKEAIPYVGCPRKNEAEPSKIYLNPSPFMNHSSLLEFKIEDIIFIEDFETVSSADGLPTPLVKIWVKKGSIALKLDYFVVQEMPSSFA